MKYAPPIGQEAQGEEAHYVDGNPELGILGSPVPAAAIEQGQRELLHVIKQAGLTPDEASRALLYVAFLKIIGVEVPVASKTEAGLVQVGDGLKATPEGLLSVLVATLTQNGIMRPDGKTCTVEDGVLKVLQQSNDYMEAWRKSWIGVPRYWRSTELPDNHCWANGDLIYFNDWPELKEIYEAGGFEGMLMGWDADVETQKANLGKWRPNAAIPTGLYTPALSGQFFRNWAPGASTNAGCWAADTGRGLRGGINTNTGLAQMSTEPLGLFALASDGVAYSGNKTSEPDSFIFDAATVWGEHAGAEFAPVHVWQPLCLYLGRPS